MINIVKMGTIYDQNVLKGDAGLFNIIK